MGMEMWFTDMAVRLPAPAVAEGEAVRSLCFLLSLVPARRSVGVALCHAAGWRGSARRAASLSPHGRGSYTTVQEPILSPASFFLFYPSPPSAHRSSINLGCLSDPERSHCAWLKLLPALQITAIEDTYTFFVLKPPLTLFDSLSLFAACPLSSRVGRRTSPRLTWFNKIPACHVLYCFCQSLLLSF